MKITLEMVYNDVQEIKAMLGSIPLFKWMAGLALFLSLCVLTQSL